MNLSLKLALLVCILGYYIIIFILLKKGLLNLKYTLLWMCSGIIMLFFVLFPRVLERIVHVLGIVELTNGLFAVVLFCVLLLLMAITSIVSALNNKVRRLIQTCALYEERIRKLETCVEEDGECK